MKVLIATDGETPSAEAEQLLVWVGDRATLDVTAFSVTTYDIDPADAPGGTVEDARAAAKGRADALGERLGREGFRVSTAVAEGDPGAEIVRKIESEGFDLVVVGSSRHRWLRERLLGTTSSYVLQNSPCSVLVVRECPEASEARMKVLVATDGSDDAETAIRSFSRFVNPARCAATVISVAQPSPEDAQGYVDAARALLDDEGISTDGEVKEGAPSPTLLQLADEGDYGLVVLGSRGLGPVRRALLGSVSDAVARYARAAYIARALT